jgi:hypothetical protein
VHSSKFEDKSVWLFKLQGDSFALSYLPTTSPSTTAHFSLGIMPPAAELIKMSQKAGHKAATLRPHADANVSRDTRSSLREHEPHSTDVSEEHAAQTT